MAPIVTALLVAAALGAFLYHASWRLLPAAALRREDRLDPLAERLRGLLRFGLGQQRLLDPDERAAGVLHVVLFATFLVVLDVAEIVAARLG